ncbi:hypothetical protein [Comamonas granuli]|uniref:hypothetical protein n=1 Tax=Comamonas granuli TaxID=290309 RepID=UPI0012EBF129|nr:hypothetical protein [Comamonas granuli]
MLTLTPAAMAQVTAEDCPANVMIAGSPYDLAGDIRAAGSAQALLARMNEALRQLPADCSQYVNRYDCDATKIVAKGVKAAVEACIAKAGSQPKASPPIGTSPSGTGAGSRNTAQPAGGGSGIDPSLYNTEDDPDGNQLFRKLAATGTPFIPKNPQNDHTGEPCVYFTKPLVRPDGGGLNAYADGSYVAYGKYYYTCRNRRWVSIGLASSFVNVQEHAASKLENSTLSPQIYEQD